MLKDKIDDKTGTFFLDFESYILDCNTTGFIQSQELILEKILLDNEERFENKHFVTDLLKCQKEYLYNKAATFEKYPSCEEIYKWGVNTFYICLYQEQTEVPSSLHKQS